MPFRRSPCATCEGCASPAGRCHGGAAPTLALALAADQDQAPPPLPAPLQAQGWGVLRRGRVGVRPWPRQRRGDGMHSLGVLLGALPGKGHVLAPDTVRGTRSFDDGDRATERGDVWFAHGSRRLGTEEGLRSPLAPSSRRRGSRMQAEARAGSGALGACTFSAGERQSLGKRCRKRQQVPSCPWILGTWCSL